VECVAPEAKAAAALTVLTQRAETRWAFEGLASAEAGSSLDLTKRCPKSAWFGPGLPDCGAPNRCLVVSDAGYTKSH